VNVTIATFTGVIKFAGRTIRLWGCTGNASCGMVQGYFRDFPTILYKSVRIGFRVFSSIYIYIYLIDVNLDY
jgi:hypothetical protein